MIMEKKQRDLAAAGALVAIFLLLVSHAAFKKKPHLSAAAVTPLNAGATDLSFLDAVRKNDELRSAQSAVWEKPWRRDPFLAQVSSAAVASRLKLNGIVWDEKNPYAMVNDKVVKVGDVIEGFRVLEIKQGSVILWSDAGKFHELKLFEDGAS
jgi:hypothetical protein